MLFKEPPKRFCEIGTSSSTWIGEPISRIEIRKHIPLISKNILETTVRNFPAKRVADTIFGMLKGINLQRCLSIPQDEVGFTRLVLNKCVIYRGPHPTAMRTSSASTMSCCLNASRSVSRTVFFSLRAISTLKRNFFVLIYLPPLFSVVEFDGWKNLFNERIILY